jgi:hypothetical protein
MALLIACFVIALFIYFAIYYEKDKKAMEQRGKSKPRRNGEDFIILPFFEDHQDGSQEDLSDSSDEVDDIIHDDY